MGHELVLPHCQCTWKRNHVFLSMSSVIISILLCGRNEGGREGRREGGREGGREGRREGGREGGKGGRAEGER